MSTLGIFNTTNFQPDAVAMQSFAGAMFKKFPGGQMPLLGFSSQAKTGRLDTHLHTWKIDTQEFPHTETLVEIPAATRGQATVFEVADATQFTQGAVVQVNGTDEQIRVQTVIDETHFLGKRGFGTVPPQVIPAGTELWRISSAFEESSLRPQARTVRSDRPLTNTTQIFRDAWALSGSAAASKLNNYGENPLQKNRKDAALQHAMDLEMSLIWGQRYETVENGQPLRKMDGILSLMRKHAPDNYHQAPAVMTMDMLEEMLDPVFDFNTDAANMNDRLLFCGKVGRRAVNKLGNYSGEKNLVPGQTAFGHRFTEFITTRGNYKVVEHPMFNINAAWSRMILVLDLSTLRTLYMDGRKTAHRSFNNNVNSGADKESVDSGIDAEGGSFLSEMTLELGLPEANAVITNVCDVAATPAPTLPTTYTASLAISHPCEEGAVDGGTQVTISVTTGKASQAFTIVTPNGTQVLTSSGAATELAPETLSFTYTLPAYVKNQTQGLDPFNNSNVYSFFVLNGAGLANVYLNTNTVSACVRDPDDVPQSLSAGSECADVTP